MDYELAPGQIAFYPLDGKSLSDSYQADFHLEPSSHFTLDLTARYTDARTTYMTGGLREVPLTSRFKGGANFQYKTNLSRWIFDLTGFRQKNVILGEKMADGMVNTATSDFDASAVWGPLMGATIYAGIRVTIWKTE